jgi:hypothetical protein
MGFEFPIPTGLQEALTGGAKQAKEYVDATAERALARLDEIRDAIDAEDTRESTVRRITSGDCLTDGTLTLEVPGPRLGFSWTIKKVSIIARGSAGSSAVLYVGAVSEGGMAHVFADADFTAEDVGDVFVPAGSAWIEISGAAPNAHVTVSVQAVEDQATPKDER